MKTLVLLLDWVPLRWARATALQLSHSTGFFPFLAFLLFQFPGRKKKKQEVERRSLPQNFHEALLPLLDSSYGQNVKHDFAAIGSQERTNIIFGRRAQTDVIEIVSFSGNQKCILQLDQAKRSERINLWEKIYRSEALNVFL